MHTQAHDASPKVEAVVIGGDEHAALEADFVGTHVAEFMGIAATGRSVTIPYRVVYHLNGDRITALPIYMPIELLAQQLGRTGRPTVTRRPAVVPEMETATATAVTATLSRTVPTSVPRAAGVDW